MIARTLLLLYVIASLMLIMFLGYNYKLDDTGTLVKSDVEIVVDKVDKRCIVSKYQHGVFESAVKRTD